MPETEPELGFGDDAPNPFDLPYDDRAPLIRLFEWARASFLGRRGLPSAPPFVLASTALVGSALLGAIGTTALAFTDVTSWANWTSWTSSPLALFNGSGVNTVSLLVAVWILTLAPIMANVPNVLRRVIRVLTAWALVSALVLEASWLYDFARNDEYAIDSAFLWSSGLDAAAVIVVSIACLAATSRARQPEPSADRNLIPI